MRTMVSGDQDMFRVVVVKKKQVRNPEWRQGQPYRPYWIFTDETHEQFYGPYSILGSARSVRTQETWDQYEKELKPGVVSARIEKGVTKWEVVE